MSNKISRERCGNVIIRGSLSLFLLHHSNRRNTLPCGGVLGLRIAIPKTMFQATVFVGDSMVC
jgi:hypothetical protein